MCAHARLGVSFLRFFVCLRCGMLATNKLLRLLQCLVRGFDLLRPVLCPVQQQQQEEQQQEQRDKSPRGVCIWRVVLRLRLCGACLCANLPWRWVCFGCSPSAPSSRPRTRSRTSQTCLLRCWACVPNWLGLQRKSGEWSVRAPLLLCCSFVLRLLLLSLVLLLLLGAAVPGGACHDDSFMGGGAMVATHMPVARMHES